jgi:hypothetical protein
MRQVLEKDCGGVAEIMNQESQPARVLWHSKLPRLELGQLLATTFTGKNAWRLVTRIDHREFEGFDPANATELVAEWPNGRAFSAECEIRWRRTLTADHYDVLVLAEDTDSMLRGFSSLGGKWSAAKSGLGLLAWGSPVQADTPHIRAETRLPRKVHYPSECENGRLTYKYYLDGSGAVQFIRLVGIE